MSRWPTAAATNIGVVPSSWQGFLSAPASSNSFTLLRCPCNVAWCNSVAPLSSATFGCKGVWSNFSKATKSLSTHAEIIFCFCSASGGYGSRTTNCTLAGGLSIVSSSWISEPLSKNNLCLNLLTPIWVAKDCFMAIAGFPSNSFGSSTASFSPDSREHTSIAHPSFHRAAASASTVFSLTLIWSWKKISAPNGMFAAEMTSFHQSYRSFPLNHTWPPRCMPGTTSSTAPLRSAWYNSLGGANAGSVPTTKHRNPEGEVFFAGEALLSPIDHDDNAAPHGSSEAGRRQRFSSGCHSSRAAGSIPVERGRSWAVKAQKWFGRKRPSTWKLRFSGFYEKKQTKTRAAQRFVAINPFFACPSHWVLGWGQAM